MALAPPPKQLRVRLPENEGVARCLHEKRLSTHEQTGGLKVNLDRTFAKAYRNVCDSEEPIRTLKDLSKIKGVGPWLIRQMKEFFVDSNQDLSPTKGKKTRESKCSLPKKKRAAPSSGSSKLSILRGKELSSDVGLSACSSSVIPFSTQRQIELQSSGTTGSAGLNGIDKKDTPYVDNSIWAMPPRQSSEEFHDAYEVVLILDDRENFGLNVCLSVMVFGLLVTDDILQKMRTKEADISCRSCFTTEILEGFDVLRTSGYADTIKMYSNLTRSIIEYYNANFSTLAESSRVCPTYDEFERNCRCLKRKTVSQIFALQLMQEGDIRAQEEMLKNKSKMVNAGASRNIFKLVWGDGCNLQL
ncbi:hypothetical protein PR202_gb03776 [Eleusine coracana subsp. coracana]|uniref:Crossover junction endonuclease MUS81 n=1 Tax=Eleusine coracana subsp. coracana TaxID=191504 RepID=A0AAV5E2T4_ELECO|nr:hypothetical protein PR202_gb03776 [Eleusine coracana subsp. coracana]